MTDITREDQLLDAFGVLADTLVADYDVVEVAQVLVDTCASLFDIEAAGLLVAGSDGILDVLASTSEASRLVEVLQLDAQTGPCLQCFRTGETVAVSDLSKGPQEWSRFIDSARDLGFHSVHALPLRHRDTVIGTLNLLGSDVGELNGPDLRAARTLADVTTLGILHERSARENAIVQQQLQNALASRITIEQAKGFLSHTKQVPVDEAFGLLRAYARSNQIRLVDAAQQIVDRTLTL